MWTRKELKQRAKEALKRNYWKAVLVSLLITALAGVNPTPSTNRTVVSDEEIGEALGNAATDTSHLEKEDAYMITNVHTGVNAVVDTIGAGMIESGRRIVTEVEQMNPAAIVAFSVVILVFVFFFIAIMIVIDIMLINPLLIGAQRFMLKSVDGRGNIAELGYTFDHNYPNGVKTSLFRDLHIFLWALLFIIPGIYKKYQYYLVDYILAENPDMPHKEVLERSKQMMDGQKWNAFVLDLSFLFWHMLGFFTCGLSEIFYVRPYLYLTRASLYRTLNTDKQL